MSAGVDQYLPLEMQLKTAARKRSAFPERTDYFRRYLNIKEWISANLLRNAGAGLAADDGTLYTQHDIGHIDDVIQSAGMILGIGHDTALVDKLNPYEIYVLLVAILLHDAGNAYGRVGHERRPFSILQKMGDVSGSNSVEKRVISNVAQAHGGRTSGGSKDTIAAIVTQDQSAIQHAVFRGRVLAGILRLADEISENPGRANYVATTEPGHSPLAEIHNVYCEHINITVDTRDRAIVADYEVPAEMLSHRFPLTDTSSTYFIDYIGERLSKCNTERIYCNRFTSEIIWFDKIRVTLRIVRDEAILEELKITIKDEGYPNSTKAMRDYDPRFDGKAMHDLHGGGTGRDPNA